MLTDRSKKLHRKAYCFVIIPLWYPGTIQLLQHRGKFYKLSFGHVEFSCNIFLQNFNLFKDIIALLFAGSCSITMKSRPPPCMYNIDKKSRRRSNFDSFLMLHFALVHISALENFRQLAFNVSANDANFNFELCVVLVKHYFRRDK